VWVERLARGCLNPKDPIQTVLDQIVQTLKRVQVQRVQTPKVLLPQTPEAVEHSGAAWRLKLKVEPD